MSGYAADFSFLELIYLSDALSMHASSPEPGDRPYPDLLELILGGIAARPTGDPDWQWTATLTRTEWWMVREVAKSSVSVGSEKVGLNLLVKCAKALTALKADDALHAAAMIVGDAEGQEADDPPDRQAKISAWQSAWKEEQEKQEQERHEQSKEKGNAHTT